MVFSVVRCGNFRIIMITKNSTGANISAGFVTEAKRLVNRKPCAMVEFLWTDAVVDPLLSVESEDKNYNVIVAQGDVLKQVTDSIDRPTHEYIILDGSWVLDEGVKGLAPYTVQEVNENQIGWGSDSLSDEDGDFTTVPFPAITVNFDPAGRALTSLKVVGDSLLNEYPVNFTITVYSATGLIHTETVTGNTAVSWRKEISGLGINNAVKIKLEISKWSAANTIAKILEFFTVETDIFAGDEIVSLGILEERSVKNGSSPVGNISCNEIDLKLQNIKITASDGVTYFDPFSFGNSLNNRFYSFLKPNRKIIAYLGFKAGGVSEYVRMGTYWTVGDWRCNEIDFSASVTAYDRMKFLKDNTFECDEISLNLQNKNLKQVAEYVLNHAKNNIPLRDLVWDISDALESYTVPVVWFDKGSYFDAVKAIAEACVGQAWMSKDDVLCIYPEKVDGSETDLEITRDMYFDKNQPSNIEEMKNVVSVTAQPIRKEYEDEKPTVFDGTGYSIAAEAIETIIIEYGNAPVSESAATLLNESEPGVLSIIKVVYLSYGCKITVQNIADSTVTFDIQVKAWRWSYSGGSAVVTKDENLIAEYGAKEEKFENHLVQTTAGAQLIAAKLMANYSIPRRDLSITWRGDPRLELGDVVEVPEYKTSTAKFVVVKNRWSFDGGLECVTDARKVAE